MVRSFCSNDPGQNLSDLDLESNPNQYQMACWAGIVTHFGETILFLIFHTSECTKFGVPNVCQTVTNCLSHILQWYSISKQLEPNPNNILSEHSIDFDRTILFLNFLTSGWTKSDVTNVWQMCDKKFVTHLSHTCHSQIPHPEKFRSSPEARHIDGWVRWATQTPQTLCRSYV